MTSNIEIAEKFNSVADLLEIQGDNPFRIRAYRNAARVIASLSHNITDMLQRQEDLSELPGIGEDLAEKIQTIVRTGELPVLTRLQKKMPPVLSEMLKISGLGPKRVKVLYKKFRIKTLADLKNIIEQGKLQKLKGFGIKSEARIKMGLIKAKEYSLRYKLAEVEPIVQHLLQYMQQIPEVKQIICAGSYRRRKDTVGDLDILVEAASSKKVMEHFIRFPEVAEVLSKGSTRSTVRLASGIQVDLRVVPGKSFGSALLYFTGSKAHNIAIRKLAIKKKLKISEYGVFAKTRQIAGRTEADVYRTVDLHYVEPELREDRGEIELARENRFPRLISLADIRGDLHCHTQATAGNASIEEVARAAKQLGYKYIAITDHSRHLTMAKGLDKSALLKQIELIDKLNNKLSGIRILKGIELDILEDGRLDLPDSILQELDLTVCAIHSNFNLPSKVQTMRVIKAMDNKYFNIFAHPTGRIINEREPYQIDLDRIMQAAKEKNCILELNAQPERMDLDDVNCHKARKVGVKIAICSAAHTTAQLNYIKYGVDQARRGWVEAEEVVNTLELERLLKVMKR